MRGQHIPRAVVHSRTVLQGLSENLYCRVLDRFASTSLPPAVMVPFPRAYCRVYGVDTEEMASPFHSYRNFREFFSRPVLRAFLTYAFWNDGQRGQVGGIDYANETAGWSWGVQMESWW